MGGTGTRVLGGKLDAQGVEGLFMTGVDVGVGKGVMGFGYGGDALLGTIVLELVGRFG
jgi:hypothetical protein